MYFNMRGNLELEAAISENADLKRKLESKAQALLILAEELSKCRRERDNLRELQTKPFLLKEPWDPDKFEFTDADSFEALKGKNKALLIEIIDLRHKLKEASADLKVLRTERVSIQSTEKKTPSPQHKEDLVREVEETKAQLRELRLDLHSLLDEKEELVTERDAYRCKVHRLNHELANMLKASSSVDIDAILMENKFTKERLEFTTEEMELVRSTMNKYKGILERLKVKGSEFLKRRGTTGVRVITNKQVRELLGKEEAFWEMAMTNKEATVSDLRALCTTLVDTLQDKTIRLTHQKKVSRMLDEQVKYLEGRLKDLAVPAYPNEILLEGYSTSEVDTLPRLQLDEIEKKETKEESSDKESEDSLQKTIIDKWDDDEKLPEELEKLVIQALQEVQASASPNI